MITQILIELIFTLGAIGLGIRKQLTPQLPKKV